MRLIRYGACVVALLAGIVACGQVPTGAQTSGGAATPVASDTLTAQGLAGGIIARNPGTATAAAYVRTTLQSYESGFGPEERNGISVGSPTDPLLIVEVVGDFTPAHSGLATTSRVPKADEIITVYDETLGAVVENSYMSPPVPPTNRPTFADLSKLGTPQPLTA
jgi:hypothetical protein